MPSLMLVNPRKRRRKTRSKTRAKRRSPSKRLSTVTTRSVRRYRRNPIKKTGIMSTVTGGAIGAAGALAADVAIQKLPIPANLKTEQMAPVTKAAVGIALGMAVSKFGKNKKMGEQLAGGAVTVALYEAGKKMIGPSLGLSGVDDSLLGWDDGLMGSDWGDDFGYTNPASTYDDSMGYYDE